jgi:uncharacterized protein YqjF (DUF2071 family)
MLGLVASPFLTARWKHLAIATYAIEQDVVEDLLPPGCVADTRDGKAFVSLVAFDFLDTKVGGVRWPGFIDFPEVNLRFYVRHGDRRGVAFVRELVPQATVAWIARALYNEPYARASMESSVDSSADRLRVHHRFEYNGATHEVEMRGEPVPHVPPSDSLEHFFKEHDHGFGTSRGGRLLEYRVYHPVWRVHDVLESRIAVDFEKAYGKRWAFLADAEPFSLVIAEGSGVAVHPAAL